MSVDCTLILVTQDEYEKAIAEAERDPYCGWYHYVDRVNCFCFGDGNDFSLSVLLEISGLCVKVEQIADLLQFIFLQGSEAGNLYAFTSFIRDNLGKNKIVKFWCE